MIPFAEFAPDRSDRNIGASDAILNVLPTADGYKPFKGIDIITAALPDTCKGAFFGKASDNDISVFAGTSTGLYKLNTTDMTWSDVSGTSAPYNLPDGDLWQFIQFGSAVIAVNINTPPQVFDLDSGSAFTDLAGSPPNARYIWTAGGFVVLGGLSSAVNQIRWSGLENAEFWTIGERGSDYQNMPDGGQIFGGVSDESGAYVFQENTIRRMQFAPSSNYTFSIQVVNPSKGCVAPHSIVSIGANDFLFLSEDGFYRGPAAQAIGAERIDAWFFELIDLDFLAEVQATNDPFEKVVWFNFKRINGDYLMIGYDWQLNKWTSVDSGVEFILGLATPGFTLEALDAISTSIDDLPYSLDSRVWFGGRPALAGFTSEKKLGYFQGGNMAATLETAEFQLSPPNRAFLNGFHVMGDCQNYTGAVGAKSTPSASLEWRDSFAPSTRSGIVPCRVSARFHKIRLSLAADAEWTSVEQVVPNYISEGQA